MSEPPEPIPAIPVPEYGVEPSARRPLRTAALVALLASGGLLLLVLLVFGLRFAVVARPRPALPATVAPAPAPAVPPATAPAAR
jgi:hypothetical protein